MKKSVCKVLGTEYKNNRLLILVTRFMADIAIPQTMTA